MSILKQILLMTLVAIVVVVFSNVPALRAAFNPSPRVWSSGTFEANPAGGDSINRGDDHIRQLKLEVRSRLQTEHLFGTVVGTAEDSGRHREGSARAFVRPTEPNSPNGLEVDDYFNGVGGNGDVAADDNLDEGRLWVDDTEQDAVNTAGDTAGFFELFVARGTKGSTVMEQVGSTMPVNAIILWDQVTGDENCDGTESAAAGDRCPCGYTEAAEFAGILPRGADIAAGGTPNLGDPNGVPDIPGTSCDADTLGTGCAGTGITTANYDDTPTIEETALHGHPYRQVSAAGTSTASGGLMMNTEDPRTNRPAFTGTPADPAGEQIGGTGGSEPHYHGFRTVVFCRKS